MREARQARGMRLTPDTLLTPLVVRAVRLEPALSALLHDAAWIGLGPALDALAARAGDGVASSVQGWMAAGISLGWWSPPTAG